MCIRCGKHAAEQDDYCPSCGVAARLEVAQGLRQLDSYLSSTAALAEPLDPAGGVTDD